MRITAIDECAPERPSIPTTQDELLSRINKAIEPEGRKVVTRRIPSGHPLEPPHIECFEATLCDKGRVRRVELERLARELGLLEDFERVLPTWYQLPG